MEVFGQKPSDKQKGRQTGKAKTGINPRAGFRTLIFCLSMHIYFYTRMPSITSFCKNKTKPEVINKWWSLALTNAYSDVSGVCFRHFMVL